MQEQCLGTKSSGIGCIASVSAASPEAEGEGGVGEASVPACFLWLAECACAETRDLPDLHICSDD